MVRRGNLPYIARKKSINPSWIVTTPVVPVIRILRVPYITIDLTNKELLKKNEKGYQENQEDIFHHENKQKKNEGGRL